MLKPSGLIAHSHLRVDDSHATLTLEATSTETFALISVANPDGRQSNILPLTILHPAILTVPLQDAASIAVNGFRFTLTGGLSQLYLVEHSPDLETWLPLSTNQFAGLPLTITDATASNVATRFYRARPLP